MKSDKRYLSIVEKTLDEVLPRPDARPEVLSEMMRYAVGSGGKRIRPLVCLAAAEAVGGKAEDARLPAAAIEFLHNYTLVHDDLPAMDDDEMRRGKPSVWRKFGEANAILAGDALQSLAFATAARAPRNAAKIVATLADKGIGVVAGQIEDLVRIKDARGGMVLPEKSVGFVYEHKTADLFIAAAVMGGLAGGGAKADIEALASFALNLGLAFQYEDDLIDGDSPWPKTDTERRVREATRLAMSALERLPGDTAFLKRLARRLVNRKS